MTSLPKRNMTPREFELLLALLQGHLSLHKLNIETLVVEEMEDGGMGSLRFVSSSNNKRSFGEEVAEVTFVDLDTVPVIAALLLDNFGDLYELDIFKADNSRLLEIPPTSKMTFQIKSK